LAFNFLKNQQHQGDWSLVMPLFLQDPNGAGKKIATLKASVKIMEAVETVIAFTRLTISERLHYLV
jgi:hypothetical protein